MHVFRRWGRLGDRSFNFRRAAVFITAVVWPTSVHCTRALEISACEARINRERDDVGANVLLLHWMIPSILSAFTFSSFAALGTEKRYKMVGVTKCLEKSLFATIFQKFMYILIFYNLGIEKR